MWTPPTAGHFSGWRDRMIEEPHDHGRLPVPGDVAAVQRAVDEATAGIGSLAAVVVSLIKCWREDVGSVVSDVMGIIAGVGVDDGAKAVALLLPFAVRLRAMQPDLTGATSAQEKRRTLLFGRTVPPSIRTMRSCSGSRSAAWVLDTTPCLTCWSG